MSYRLSQVSLLNPVPRVIRSSDHAYLPTLWKDGAAVPLDEYSPLVIEFVNWAAAGNTPAPYTEEVLP